MFEFHGWAVIRSTDYYADANEAVDAQHDQDLIAALRAKINHINESTNNFYCHLDHNSYDWVLLLTGHSNHRRSTVFELFEWLALHGPGSYGLLYIQDDEDHCYEEDFRVWRLARGQLSEHADAFLSPRIPTTEQPFQDD